VRSPAERAPRDPHRRKARIERGEERDPKRRAPPCHEIRGRAEAIGCVVLGDGKRSQEREGPEEDGEEQSGPKGMVERFHLREGG